MSGKLDQSLDEILSTQRRTPRARAGRRSSTRAAATVAPTNGVKKATKGPKPTGRTVPTGPSAATGDSKIMVSNLPKDVNEHQIKEYFVNAVGPIKRTEISYGPNGQSRGIASITFHRGDGAAKALKVLDGLLVDNKPMKIEILVDASRAGDLPAPKGLKDRIAQPKNAQKVQPKPAAGKPTTGAAARGNGKKRGGKAGRSARPAKKTAEELDSEMADYFDAGATAAGATTTDAAQPATVVDAMDEEVL